MLNEELPNGLEKYRDSPVFTEETLPQALQKAHCTKAGVWGLVKVLAGSIHYVLENNTGEPIPIPSGKWVIIHPQERHHVELCGPVRFQIEFYRQA